MIFDTDVLIWAKRGNVKAAKLINETAERYISILTRMELIQGAKNKEHVSYVEGFISDYDFNVLSLTENIGHRGLIYMEEYSLSHGLIVTDALIAATAAENGLGFCTSNVKHFKQIKDLELVPFHP